MCKNGNHKLKVIFACSSHYNDESVVRWCSECGCVVVDIDSDNRTSPGAIMKMKAPKSFKRN